MNEFIEKYRSEGLSFFPIPFKSKQAVIEWKFLQERLPTGAEVSQWFNGNPSNIAVVCGRVSGNLVILDCDSQEKFAELAAIICQHMGIEDIREFTRISKTSKGYHIWLRTKEPVKSQKFPQLDIKGEGGYIIAPPSVHPFGDVYEFINDKPIVKVDNLKLIGIDIEQKPDEPSNQPGWVSQLLADGTSEGQRNDSAAKLAGYFRNTLPQDVTERIMLDWNTRSTPPLPEREVLQVIASVYRKPEHPTINPLMAKNNNSFINIGGSAENRLETGQERDKNGTTSANWGDYSKKFDEVVKEAGKIAKRDVAEAIGLRATSDTFRKLVSRRIDEGKIRPHKGSPNVIEWINRNYQITSLMGGQAEIFLPVTLPLGLSSRVKIPPGSVIGLAGYTSAGKTSFLLELAELNCLSQPMPVYYWYNEMSEARLRIRCEDFPKLLQAADKEKFIPVKQSDFEIADVLQPDCINLYDYLDRDDELYLIGQDIKQLQSRLNTGIVVFGVQKPKGRDLGYGGIPSAKLSNLYFALDVEKQKIEGLYGRCKVVKAKDWTRNNPVEMYCFYHTGGEHGKLFLDGGWHYSDGTLVDDEN